MKRSKELKKLLSDRYIFIPLLSQREVRRLQNRPPNDHADRVVASLIAGCVKMEAVLYRDGKKLLLGYDVFVKDDPDSQEWILYVTPNDCVSLKETEMLAVLDRIVMSNGLSYTECCFERMDGKIVKLRKKLTE